MEGNFKFPKDETFGEDLKDLIKSMIKVDINKRISLKEVINSDWLKSALKREFERNSFLINKEKERLKIDAIFRYL